MSAEKTSIPPPIAIIRQMQTSLLQWHTEHGRHHLPWQQNRSPYRVWVSEIMLQQTQVSTVIPYFERFIERYPDLHSLAVSSLDEVLVHWQGLGYYRRARHLHQCAQTVVTRHGGQFPVDLNELGKLPGIGRSTAGAILSMAMTQRASILDGNVKRILARCFMIEGWTGQPQVEKRLWELTEALTPASAIDCAQHSQALMDLGATLCRRHNPLCKSCPWFNHCLSRIHDCQTEYPWPRPGKPKVTRDRYLLWLENSQGKILLLQRPQVGIWPGLWSLPESEHQECLLTMPYLAEVLKYDRDRQIRMEALSPFRHAFTHFTGIFHTFRLRIPAEYSGSCLREPENSRWVSLEDLQGLALPSPVRQLIGTH